MPAATGEPESTWKLSADHSAQPPNRPICRSASSETSLAASAAPLDLDRDDPELPGVQARARAGADEAVEHVRVVRDEEQLGGALLVAVGPGEAQVERLGARAEQLGQHLLDRLQLGVAVGLGLDDLGVDAERDVVHEDPVVHERQVDRALDPRVERVERADDVVAVEPEVEGEVVARPRGDADVGDAVLHRDLRDERLRPVAARHPDHVGRAGRLAREGPQVVVRAEHDRLDAAPASPPRRARSARPCRRPTSGSSAARPCRSRAALGRFAGDAVAADRGRRATARPYEGELLVEAMKKYTIN